MENLPGSGGGNRRPPGGSWLGPQSDSSQENLSQPSRENPSAVPRKEKILRGRQLSHAAWQDFLKDGNPIRPFARASPAGRRRSPRTSQA